jgi:hypothetical protein
MPASTRKVPTGRIRAGFRDLEHIEVFGDFAESISYAGTACGKLPTPPASNLLKVNWLETQ